MKKEFPTMEDFERIAKLNNYYQIFKGRHSEVFRLKSYFEEDAQKRTLLYLAYNVAQIISLTSADFLFGEGLKIKTEDKTVQKKIDELMVNQHLDEKFYQSSLMQDSVGFTVFLVRKKDGQAVVEEVPYDNYFPDFSGCKLGENPREIVIGSYVELVNPQEDKKRVYLYKQIHTIGKIEHELWTTTADMYIHQKVDLALYDSTIPEMETTDLDYIPIFQVDNFKTVKERFGISTYESVMNLLEELNDRITQISVQLIKHLNAKVAVGEGILDKDGTVDSMQDVFLVEKGDIVPQYITNSNSLIEEGFKQVESVLRQICTVTQTPTSYVGLDDQGGAEKVETVKIRLASFLKKIKRKQRAYESKISQIIKTALVFEGVKSEFSLDFVWDYGLPRDYLLEAQTHQILVESGIESIETAMREMKDFDQETITQELEKIRNQFLENNPNPHDKIV